MKREKPKSKTILCKMGLHFKDRERVVRNFGHRQNNATTSYSAICKYCGKSLYLVDRYGRKKERQ